MNKKVTLNKLKHGATPDLNVYNTLILHNYFFSTVEDGSRDYYKKSEADGWAEIMMNKYIELTGQI